MTVIVYSCMETMLYYYYSIEEKYCVWLMQYWCQYSALPVCFVCSVFVTWLLFIMLFLLFCCCWVGVYAEWRPVAFWHSHILFMPYTTCSERLHSDGGLLFWWRGVTYMLECSDAFLLPCCCYCLYSFWSVLTSVWRSYSTLFYYSIVLFHWAIHDC